MVLLHGVDVGIVYRTCVQDQRDFTRVSVRSPRALRAVSR
jgi:hypothetical protein